MFSWICPQCGNEVPPSYDQCPKCADKAASDKPVDTPQPVEPAPPPPAAAPAPPPAPAPARVAPPPSPPPYGYAPPRQGPPGWLVTLGVFGVLAGLGYGLYWWTNRTPSGPVAAETRQESAPAPIKLETPQPAKQDPTPTGAQLAKHLEASGIRFTEERRRTSVTMTIINHFNAEMVALDGSIKISTRDDSKHVATVQFKMANLGPLEAKDYTIAMLTTMRPYEMPDWQFLKAEITLK